MKQFLAQNKNGDVCYIVEEEGQLVAKVRMNGSDQPTAKYPILGDSPLYQYMMAGNIDKAYWD